MNQQQVSMYLFRFIYKPFHNNATRNLSSPTPSRNLVLIVILWSLSVFASPNSHADWHLVDTLKGHTNAVNSIAFSSDGRLLASGSKDKTVIIWNALTGRRERTLTGHNGEIYSVAFSSDGQMLASASEDGNIILWNPETGEKLTITHNDVHSIAFSPDGQLLASGSWLGTVRLWNPNIGKQIQEEFRHGERVLSVAFSPDGTLLASSSWDYTIRLWNLKQKKAVNTIGLRGGMYANFVTFSPDGRLLASGIQDGTIKLWNPETGTMISDIAVKKNPVVSVAFSSDSQLLAADAQDNTIKIWNIKTQREITTLKGHQGNVNSAAFSPKNNLLASASSDGTVKLWQDTELSIIILDTTSAPPKTVITGSQIQERSATFRFAVDPITVSDKLQYFWQLDKGQKSGKTEKTSVTLDNLSDGFHLFEVEAIDMDGNKDLTPAEASFYVKPTPAIVTSRAKLPETKIISEIRSPIKTTDITIRFKGEDTPQTPEDKLRYKWCFDSGEWFETKETSVTLNNLLNGWHFFQVKAIGIDNEEDKTPAGVHFEVAIEEQLPETYIVSAPEDTVKTSEVTIWFRGSDAQTPFEKLRYKWRFDGREWFETKETSVTLEDLSSEWHLLEVKAINTNGYEDLTPTQVRFTVDISEELPETQITYGPKDMVKAADFTFLFDGKSPKTPREQLRYSWCLDDNPWSPLSNETMARVEGLSSGKQLFQVKAVDASGKEDLTPAEQWFMVEIDKKLPDTIIIEKVPELLKANDVTIKFKGIDSDKELKYSWCLDGGEWSKPISEGFITLENLSSGWHKFEVKAITSAGGDPTPAVSIFQVDIDWELPKTAIKEAPESKVKTSDVTFRFTGEDLQTPTENLQYSWRINEGPRILPTEKKGRLGKEYGTRNAKWQIGEEKEILKLYNLDNCRHLFEVKAIDPDGNEDPTPVMKLFVVAAPFYESVFFISGVSSAFGGIVVFICLRFFVIPWIRRRRKFNPYIIGEPVINQKMFFGRGKLLEEAIDALKGSSIAIYGDRRIGKTTFLRQIEKRLEKPYLPIFWDLGGTSGDEFLSQLIRVIIDGCKEYLNEIPELHIQQDESKYRGPQFGMDLLEIIKQLQSSYAKDVILVLLLDEIDQTDEYDQRVHQDLRAVFMKEVGRLKMVTAGVAVAGKQWSKPTSPWYNFFNLIEVPTFNPEDATELIRSPVKHIYKYSKDAVDCILRYSDCQPYYIQVFCRYAIEKVADEKKKQVELEYVEYVLTNVILKDESHVFQQRWNDFSEEIQKKIQVALEIEEASDDIEIGSQSNILNELNITNPFKEWIRRSRLQ